MRTRRELAALQHAILDSNLGGTTLARRLGVSEAYVSRVRMRRSAIEDTTARDAGIRVSLEPNPVLARRHGLTSSRISQIRLGTPDDGWVADCMEPDEWTNWLERNPRALGGHAVANRPCVDCPLGFAAEMRAIGRCNGSPGAIGGRHELDDEEGEDEGPMLNQNERGQSGGVRGAQALELVPPPCETCLHEPICVLRIALQKTRSADVAVAPLPDGLSVVVTARVDCRFYNAAKKPKRVMSEAGRAVAAASAEKARAAWAAKRAGSPA